MSEFRAFCTSHDGQYFAGCTDAGLIRIWDATDLSLVATLYNSFEDCDLRMAIDPENHLLFSGAWDEGLSCHNYLTGAHLWHRDDVPGIQKVDYTRGFSASIHIAAEIRETEPDETTVLYGVIELDSRSGKMLWRDPDAYSMFLHPSDAWVVMENRDDRTLSILDGSKQIRGSLGMAYFAIMDVAFNGDLIAVAEGTEGVRIIDRQGKVLARLIPTNRECHFIQAGFDRSTGNWLFMDNEEDSFLAIVDGKSGKLLSERQGGSWSDVNLIGDGSRFVDSEGQVHRTSDGEVLAQLAI
jgi:hypothetical protein